MPEASDFKLDENKYIEMPSGRRFFMADPIFYLPDIAYVLARQPRWNATSSKFISVAEHSIRVSYLIQEEGGKPFEGLCHDVTETWLGDVPGPWKSMLPDFVALEAYLWKSFVERLPVDCGVNAPELNPDGHTAECKRADWRALFIEAHEVMPSQGRDWFNYDDYARTTLDMPCHFWDPEEAEERFQIRWDELTWDPTD
jgi:hypothetical protein